MRKAVAARSINPAPGWRRSPRSLSLSERGSRSFVVESSGSFPAYSPLVSMYAPVTCLIVQPSAIVQHFFAQRALPQRMLRDDERALFPASCQARFRPDQMSVPLTLDKARGARPSPSFALPLKFADANDCRVESKCGGGERGPPCGGPRAARSRAPSWIGPCIRRIGSPSIFIAATEMIKKPGCMKAFLWAHHDLALPA